jgi:RNA polymerase sigma-70 factor (ECF subfamily)
MLGSGSEAEDAVMSMPPFAMWVRGAREIGHFMLEPTPSLCRGSRLVPVSANGCPASGHYKPGPAGGLRAWSLQVLEVVAGRITGFHCFLGTETLFPYFGLPLSLDGQAGE